MENNSGFDPLNDTLNVLSQLEFIYFVPMIIIGAILILTGTFKRRFPTRYKWQKGEGFKRIDAQDKFESLTTKQQEEVKRRIGDV